MGNAPKQSRPSCAVRAGAGSSFTSKLGTAGQLLGLVQTTIVVAPAIARGASAAWGWINKGGRAVRVARAMLHLSPVEHQDQDAPPAA